MKRTSITVTLACAWLGVCSGLAAGETNKTISSAERIGIYDSRVVAYASFWSEAQQRRINELAKAARAAKAAGDTNRFNELDAALKLIQEQGHLQVFSTAPVDDILAGLKDRVAEVEKEAGVSRLVSKWDETTLKEYKRAGKVDVTDLLLRGFKLTEKQLKVAESFKTNAPLPLDKAKEMLRKGEL
jgi:hypothetical protein